MTGAKFRNDPRFFRNDTGRPARILKIVVADDNLETAESLATMLELMGHDTQTGRDGNQALALFRSFEPDVMILDIGMPDLDGLGVAELIRAEARRDIMLIALSGRSEQRDVSLSIEAGFDHHLTKPLKIEALNELLMPRL